MDWTYGAHGVIAEVDPETGEYKVIKIASAFDVGKVINPGTIRGQCIGGMIQGLGTAECESYIYDDQGHLLNPSLTDNKILTSKDLPEEIECIAVETPQLDGPFGARGVGEHPMISVAPALANAIHDATGAELTHMPVRFEDVWRAIHNKAARRHLGNEGTGRLGPHYLARARTGWSGHACEMFPEKKGRDHVGK